MYSISYLARAHTSPEPDPVKVVLGSQMALLAYTT